MGSNGPAFYSQKVGNAARFFSRPSWARMGLHFTPQGGKCCPFFFQALFGSEWPLILLPKDVEMLADFVRPLVGQNGPSFYSQRKGRRQRPLGTRITQRAIREPRVARDRAAHFRTFRAHFPTTGSNAPMPRLTSLLCVFAAARTFRTFYLERRKPLFGRRPLAGRALKTTTPPLHPPLLPHGCSPQRLSTGSRPSPRAAHFGGSAGALYIVYAPGVLPTPAMGVGGTPGLHSCFKQGPKKQGQP